MVTDLQQARVCIVGLGLMGGSLGLALRSRRACRTVIGSDRHAGACQQAVALGAVDAATPIASDAVMQADVVVLATPVRTIIRLIGELAPHAQPGSLLMDLGSTKTAIVDAMEALPSSIEAVGGHPMCGKERAGIAAADAGLFDGATFCLTPLARTGDGALNMAIALVSAVGARPLVLDAKRHDALVAATSHLPYLMAVALTATTGDTAAADPLTWQLAASGFRDTSRLAASDIDMMLDILLTNRQHVAVLARQAGRRLDALAALLDNGDEDTLRALLAGVQRIRQGVVTRP